MESELRAPCVAVTFWRARYLYGSADFKIDHLVLFHPFLPLGTESHSPNCCYYVNSTMPTTAKTKPSPADLGTTLAQHLSEALTRERIVPRFVDSYVEQHSRYGLQVHAALYRDLLTLLHREALLAISAKAMELVTKGAANSLAANPKPLARRDATLFRQRYISALTRGQKWNAGEALDFQSDLQMYEEIVARAASPQRRRKPFEVANHPFVDRSAFVLDSSFMEKARVAASNALSDLELLTARITEALSNSSREDRTTRQR